MSHTWCMIRTQITPRLTTHFRPWEISFTALMLSRNGPMTFGNIREATNLSFHPTGISRWATIAITVLIAATGVLWIAARSWAPLFDLLVGPRNFRGLRAD